MRKNKKKRTFSFLLFCSKTIFYIGCNIYFVHSVYFGSVLFVHVLHWWLISNSLQRRLDNLTDNEIPKQKRNGKSDETVARKTVEL